MPGFDGTGPAGMGPMTGGARGWCTPYGPRSAGNGPYRGPYPAPVARTDARWPGRPRWGLGRRQGRGLWGRGWGRGRGRGWW
jgi:hypothetical protein